MKFKCTFTGVDESTSFIELSNLIRAFPFIEFGILFSYSRAGKEPRYPSLDFIKEFATWAKAFNTDTSGLDQISIALHICGQAAKDCLQVTEPSDERFATLKALIPSFDRVQLNINLKEFELDWLKKSIEIVDRGWSNAMVGWKLESLGKEYKRPFIIQYNDNNAAMIDFILPRYLNTYLHVLKDASGGKGVVIDDFSIPKAATRCGIGFAGGLNVCNVPRALMKSHDSVMAANVEGHNNNPVYWIDMESGVRTDDKFDLQKVREVATIVKEYMG